MTDWQNPDTPIEIRFQELEEKYRNLACFVKKIIAAEPTMSKRKAGKIVGSARRAQMIDVGDKDTTKAENATVHISTRKIFEELTKIRMSEL